MASRSVAIQPRLDVGIDLRDGVLVLDGYGIRVAQERGHLMRSSAQDTTTDSFCACCSCSLSATPSHRP
jgi:hypothetical protein